MNWLAQLSFPQALRWALLWPAIIVAAVLAAVAFVVATRWSGDWAFALGVDSRGPLAVVIAGTVVLVGPSAVFLALWKVARR